MDENKVHYLTAESLVVLQKEYDELKDKTIPEIGTRIDAARQQGDLAENAEYHQAREDMSWALGRLQELELILKNAAVINQTQKSSSIQIGGTVVVRVDDKKRVYTIVGPQEVDPAAGRISNESPLGEALLGNAVGDRVEVNTPSGQQIYEILEIR